MNIVKLREELIGVFDGLKTGRIRPPVAVEMNNAAGKIINTAKIELEYAKLRGVKPVIPFLDAEAQ